MCVLRFLIFLVTIRTGSLSGAAVERECSPIFRDIDLGPKRHVMCMSRSPKVVWRATTNEEKLYIVDKHNELRAHVDQGLHQNPTAAYMMKLKWDDMLAAMAQAYAETCPKAKVQNNVNIFPGRFQVEQNFDSFRDIKNWEKCMERWGTIERNKFKYGDASVKWYQYHHYSRIVFASNTLIGCGMAMCNDTGSSYLRHIFVCNYGPRVGNQVIPRPYESGTPCSKCPGTCSGNLCDCLGHTCRNGGRLDPETCKCGCETKMPFKNMYTPSECALNCTKATKSTGKDLAFYCGMTNWNKCSYLYVLQACPVFCKVCPAADSTFMPEVPYVDEETKKDETDAFDETSKDEGNDVEVQNEPTEAPANVAKPSQKLNDDVIIQTKTEINTEGDVKKEEESMESAEKAIEEAKENAAAKTKQMAEQAADDAIDNYVGRFLNGTNDRTKEKVWEYLKQYNITMGGAPSHSRQSVLIWGTLVSLCLTFLLQ